MQEPVRYNLLSVLQKNLRTAQKKIFLHRVIYFGSFNHGGDLSQSSRVFSILMESNIKLINEDYCEDMLTGFGLFYTGHFINIVEGPEETIIRHLKSLTGSYDHNTKRIPEITKAKVLLVSHNINRRYYNSWNGRLATPPLLLEKIEQSQDIEVNSRHVQHCLMKLYRISEYLRNQNPNYVRATMDNISDLCRHYLPEVNLLEFLLESPALSDLRDYIQTYGKVPEYSFYHELVWPLPSSFVPRNIIEDNMKQHSSTVQTDSRSKVVEDTVE